MLNKNIHKWIEFLRAERRASMKRQKGTKTSLPATMKESIHKWIEFLQAEKNATSEEFFGKRQKGTEISLPATRIWREPAEGVFMELNTDTMNSAPYFNSSQPVLLKPDAANHDDGTIEYKAIIKDIRNNRMKLHILKTTNKERVGRDRWLSLKEMDNVHRWIIDIAESDQTESVLSLLETGEYKKYPGYQNFLKTFEKRDLNNPFKRRKQKTVLGNSQTVFNNSQRDAILAVLDDRREFVAIHGPPGTGKTKVISEIVHQCLFHGKRMVVCAPTNKAVENAFKACIKRGVDQKKCVRLGLSEDENAHITSMMKQHQFYPELEEYCQERETHEKETGATAENLKAIDWIREVDGKAVKGNELEYYIQDSIIRESRVIFCTTTYSRFYKYVSDGLFKPDLIIMDEAGQIAEPYSWRMLLQSPRFVIVGDHFQLEQYSRVPYSDTDNDNYNDNDKAEKPSSSREEHNVSSLLERLLTLKELQTKKDYLHMLDVNYRSNELIMQWSNKMFYGGKLTSHPRNESIHLSDITSNRQTPQAKSISNCYRPHHLGQERRNYGETESKY